MSDSRRFSARMLPSRSYRRPCDGLRGAPSVGLRQLAGGHDVQDPADPGDVGPPLTDRQIAERVEWRFALTSAVACVGVHERDPLEQFLESLFELHCGVVLGEWRAQTFQGREPGQPFVALVVLDHVERTEIRAV
jgi:hypothetical protein